MKREVEFTSKGIKKAQEGEPIKSLEDVSKLKAAVRGKSKKLNKHYVYLLTGLNTALRVSDILELRVKDIIDGYVRLIETKTRKGRKFRINDTLMDIYHQWIKQENLSDDDFLFFSNKDRTKHIDKSVIYKMITKAIKEADIKVHGGTHILRKTFAYHFYKQTKDLALLMEILNHSSIQVTRRYIGITQEVIDKNMEEFIL